MARAENRLSLGEGGTPLVPARSTGERLGLDELYIKDESPNPTGSFKARGLCLAVAMARELGARKLAIPSAGNAASALAAYAARAGLEAHLFMPRDAPESNIREAEVYGAKLSLVDGLITECGRLVEKGKEREGWFDVSTLKEPYRIEGKKTLGYELAEQFGWKLPDVILYPTGGGTGLIGMWKAFDEMEQLGWIGPDRPRMVTVQAEGCAPIVRAFDRGEEAAEEWVGGDTIAAGLRVPRAIGDFLMLRILRESRGTALSVPDSEILAAMRRLAQEEGIFACPEGAACLPALERLAARGWIRPEEKVVVFNTASGLKYLHLFSVSSQTGRQP